MNQRIVRRAADQSRAAVSDLLEAVLVAELISAGSRLLVISPWITDFPVVDNRSGRYAHLDPQWGASRIRFSAVLRSLLLRGTRLSVACRPGPREDEFLSRLKTYAISDGTDDLLRLQRSDEVMRERAHEKALVADSWALHGSMNFTYSGVELNGELVTFTTDAATVATLASELSPIVSG